MGGLTAYDPYQCPPDPELCKKHELANKVVKDLNYG